MKEIVLTERLKEHMRKKGALGIRIFPYEQGHFPKGCVELVTAFVWDQDFIDKRRDRTADVVVETDCGTVLLDPGLEYWKRTVTLDWKGILCFHKITADGIFIRTSFTSIEVPIRHF